MPGDGIHQVSLGQNARIEIVQVTSFGNSLARAVIADITALVEKFDWSYNRIGGCGQFEATLITDLDVASYISNGYEVIIRLGIQAGSLDLFYRGKITDYSKIHAGDQVKTILRGFGLISELSNVVINQTYTDTVANIVSNIIQTYVAPESRVKWNAGKVGAATYSVTNLKFKTTALKAIKLLAEIQTGIEWGVDEDGDFFFKPKATTVTNANHIFQIGHNVFDFEEGGSGRFDQNSLLVEGQPNTQAIYTRTVTDTTDSGNRGKKERTVSASSFVTNADVDRWAAEVRDKTKQGETIFSAKLANLRSRLEDAIPITKFRIISESGTQTDYDLWGVDYSIGTTRTGAPTKDALNPKSSTLFNLLDLGATIHLGRQRRTLIDEVEAIQNDVENLREKWAFLAASAAQTLTHVETKTISSAVQTTTFSGLDGNNDVYYLMIFRLIPDGTSAAGVNYMVRPNATTSNMRSTRIRFDSNGTANTIVSSEVSSTEMFIGQGFDDNGLGSGQEKPTQGYLFFNARAVADSPRALQSFSLGGPAISNTPDDWTPYNIYLSVGIWQEDTTNITSLEVRASTSNGIGIDSRISLYKFAIS